MELTCKRCGKTWETMGDKKPKTCAKCNSPYWDKPMTDYWRKVRESNKAKKQGER